MRYLARALVVGLVAAALAGAPALARMTIMDDLFDPSSKTGWCLVLDDRGKWWSIVYRDLDGSGDYSPRDRIVRRIPVLPRTE